MCIYWLFKEFIYDYVIYFTILAGRVAAPRMCTYLYNILTTTRPYTTIIGFNIFYIDDVCVSLVSHFISFIKFSSKLIYIHRAYTCKNIFRRQTDVFLKAFFCLVILGIKHIFISIMNVNWFASWVRKFNVNQNNERASIAFHLDKI